MPRQYLSMTQHELPDGALGGIRFRDCAPKEEIDHRGSTQEAAPDHAIQSIYVTPSSIVCQINAALLSVDRMTRACPQLRKHSKDHISVTDLAGNEIQLEPLTQQRNEGLAHSDDSSFNKPRRFVLYSQDTEIRVQYLQNLNLIEAFDDAFSVLQEMVAPGQVALSAVKSVVEQYAAMMLRGTDAQRQIAQLTQQVKQLQTENGKLKLALAQSAQEDKSLLAEKKPSLTRSHSLPSLFY